MGMGVRQPRREVVVIPDCDDPGAPFWLMRDVGEVGGDDEGCAYCGTIGDARRCASCGAPRLK